MQLVTLPTPTTTTLIGILEWAKTEMNKKNLGGKLRLPSASAGFVTPGKRGARLTITLTPIAMQTKIEGLVTRSERRLNGSGVEVVRHLCESMMVSGFEEDLVRGPTYSVTIDLPANKWGEAWKEKVPYYVSDLKRLLREEMGHNHITYFEVATPSKVQLREGIETLKHLLGGPPKAHRTVRVLGYRDGVTMIMTRNNDEKDDLGIFTGNRETVSKSMDIPTFYDPNVEIDKSVLLYSIEHNGRTLGRPQRLVRTLLEKIVRNLMEQEVKKQDELASQHKTFIPRAYEDLFPIIQRHKKHFATMRSRRRDRQMHYVPWEPRISEDEPYRSAKPVQWGYGPEKPMIGGIMAFWLFEAKPDNQEEPEDEKTKELNEILENGPTQHENFRYVLYSNKVLTNENVILEHGGQWYRDLPEDYVYVEFALGLNHKQAINDAREWHRKMQEVAGLRERQKQEKRNREYAALQHSLINQ